MEAATTSTIDRMLAWVGGGDSPAPAVGKVLVFRRYLLIHLAVEGWFRYTMHAPHRPADFVFAAIFTMCVAFGLFRRFNRAAGEIVAVAVLCQIAWWFPFSPNHLYVEGLVVVMLALFDPVSEEESALSLKGLRWLVLLVLFWGGMKKLLYGFYFDATFFGQMVGLDRRFKEFSGLILTPEEHVRLIRLFWPGPPGAGPYTVNSAAVVAMSNLVWILGLAVPLGLLVRRLRSVAMVLGILLSVGIAVVTREVFLAALLVNLLLLYARRELNRRLLPLFLLLFAWMLLIAFGVLPRWEIS